MSSCRYIDIHTHCNGPRAAGVIAVESVSLECSVPDQLHTSGVHPWHADRLDVQTVLSRLEEHLVAKKFVGVGEIGLDRACSVAWENQVLLFEEQLVWAQHNAKPVVLHCVRSYYDIIAIVKKRRISVPLIFHGYRGNSQITNALLAYNCYFSFGAKELELSAVREIPIANLFLETDCNCSSSIEQVYERAGKVFNLPVDTLVETICANAIAVFGEQFLKD